MAGSKSENETELKIKLSPKDLEKVFRKLIKKENISDISHKYLPRMYYDTAALDLYHDNMSLRVQYKSGKHGKLGGYEQTVKLELEPSAPLHKGVLFRKECKNKVKIHRPDLSAVTDRQARMALVPFKNKKLMHIFTAAIERRFFDMKVRDGHKKGMVEVAFDVGRIILPHNNRHRDFFEIELEVKRGGAEFIDVVKDEILRIAPSAKIQRLSKSEQGTRFYLKNKK